MILFTRDNFVALIRSAEGTPYLYGGIDPFGGGADCSGLVYWAGLQCGVALPRTTEAEWGQLPHVPSPQVGDLVEFEVPGDGGTPPQHVGIFVGAGVMIDDPHTGTVVKQEAIPVEPGVIWPIGYVRLPFIASPPPIPATPSEEDMIAHDTTSGGNWVVRSNGNVYAFDGAPYIGPEAKYLMSWGIGTTQYPIVGIVSDNSGGFVLAVENVGAAQPKGTYHIPSNAQYAQ